MANVLAKPLKALMRLANLPDDPKAFEHFAGDSDNSWFLHVQAPEWWSSPQEHKPPAFVPEKLGHLWRQRESLRQVWRGDIHILAALLIPPEDPSDDPYIEKLGPEGRTIGFVRNLPILFDWQSSRIVYSPQTVFQNALYLLFKESSRVKVCPNPDCPARYFIAGKPAQRHCSEKCAGEALRESKRRSWHEHKREWRPKGKKKRKH